MVAKQPYSAGSDPAPVPSTRALVYQLLQLKGWHDYYQSILDNPALAVGVHLGAAMYQSEVLQAIAQARLVAIPEIVRSRKG